MPEIPPFSTPIPILGKNRPLGATDPPRGFPSPRGRGPTGGDVIEGLVDPSPAEVGVDLPAADGLPVRATKI